MNYGMNDLSSKEITVEKCPYCGGELSKDVIRCKSCGKMLPPPGMTLCSHCKGLVRVDTVKCDLCGKELEAVKRKLEEKITGKGEKATLKEDKPLTKEALSEEQQKTLILNNRELVKQYLRTGSKDSFEKLASRNITETKERMIGYLYNIDLLDLVDASEDIKVREAVRRELNKRDSSYGKSKSTSTDSNSSSTYLPSRASAGTRTVNNKNSNPNSKLIKAIISFLTPVVIGGGLFLNAYMKSYKPGTAKNTPTFTLGGNSSGGNTNTSSSNSSKSNSANVQEDIKFSANSVLHNFIQKDYARARTSMREEHRILNNINFKDTFEEYSGAIMAGFLLEQKTTGINAKVQYEIDNIRMVDGNNAVVTFAIKSGISGDTLRFNASAVRVQNEWKVDMESFLLGITELINKM